MTKTEFNKIKTKLQNLVYPEFIEELVSLVYNLIKEKKLNFLKEIYLIYKNDLFSEAFEIYFYSFDLALGLRESGEVKEAKEIYQWLLENKDKSSAVLNNLAIIIEEEGSLSKAKKLLEEASLIDEDDEIVKHNLKRVNQKIQTKEEEENLYKESVERLYSETPWLRDRLLDFIKGAKITHQDIDNSIAIANWQFRTWLKVAEERANDIKKQMVDKGYIEKVNNSNHYSQANQYKINPYLEIKLLEIKNSQSVNIIPDTWVKALDNLANEESLREISYQDCLLKISKVINTDFQKIIKRDFQELVLNYLVCNFKSVLIISGSLIETILIYHCVLNNVSVLILNNGSKTVNIKIYDTTLNNLINYFEQNKNLVDLDIVILANFSRLYRNFIHPGKELKDKKNLDKTVANISYNAVVMLIQNILK